MNLRYTSHTISEVYKYWLTKRTEIDTRSNTMAYLLSLMMEYRAGPNSAKHKFWKHKHTNN